MRRTLTFSVCASLFVAGCTAVRVWEMPSPVIASEAAVAAALGDEPATNEGSGGPLDLPDIPMPQHIRPCCAFGYKLKVELGAVPIPGFVIGNIRSLNDLGQHHYDAGLVTLEFSKRRGVRDDENNGLAYTCRGGFIDTAHVRDNADLTVFLSTAIEKQLAGGGTIHLAHQGGARHISITPVDPQIIERYGRRVLAADVAAWAAFQVSIWHEIAQWYGYESVPGIPERVSAFSPEDLYSNVIGIRLARQIVFERFGLVDDQAYDEVLDAWIRQALLRLEVVSKKSARHAMQSVDGIWWDSTKRLPDWKLVLRRHFGIGPDMHPWLVSNATPPSALGFSGCNSAATPLVARIPSAIGSLPYSDIATVSVDVDPALARANFPFPRTGDGTITQADFPEIIAVIEAANRRTFGPDAEHP